MAKMNLNEFLETERQILKNFEEFWKVQQIELPDFFPNTLESGDWTEQLLAFQSNDKEKSLSCYDDMLDDPDRP